MSLKQHVPWWAKIAAKVVLSRTPVRRGFLQRLGLFLHGDMQLPEYAYRVVMSHIERLGWRDLNRKVVLELGPGDSLFTAVIARAFGARRTYLVDSEPFVSADAAPYRALTVYLRDKGLQPPPIGDNDSLSDILRACDATYLTRGVEDLRSIPSGSVDLIFSQAVLEHVRLGEFDATVHEMQRLLAPTGLSSHQVDLKDHLGGALNNLRFSRRVWESPIMAESGFYTNRLRFSQILDVFRESGLDPRPTDVVRWARLPTPRHKLAPEFRVLGENELLVQQFDVVARRTDATSGAVRRDR